MAGENTIMVTATVQSHDGDSTVQEKNQQQRQRGRNQAAAEIVEYLPAGKYGRSVRLKFPLADGTRGRSHCAICQSPRIQRWRRLASAR